MFNFKVFEYHHKYSYKSQILTVGYADVKMPNLINVKDETNLSGYILIIPSVSVGNVPQLTVDLLISSYNFKKYSTLWHPAIISSVGSDPYHPNTSEVCTSCELYINEQLKLAALQLRSTVEYKLALKFFNDLRDLLVCMNFKSLFILSSAFDYELHSVLSEKFFSLSNTKNDEVLEVNHIKHLEPDLYGKYFLNGGGFAVKLYEICVENLPCTLLVKYVSEGDNRPDAVLTLKKLFALLELDIGAECVKCPYSWQFVFGGPPPLGIF